MAYSWKAPVLAYGDWCEFIDHYGNARVGRCTHVVTTYGFQGDGVARHSYTVRPEGRSRGLHVGDKNIRRVLRTPSPGSAGGDHG